MQIPNEVLLWQFGGAGDSLSAINNYKNNEGYNLHCEANKKYLTWVPNQASVNLGYITNGGERKVHCAVADGADRAITTGEPISLGIGAGEAFLYYGHQTVGINLKWSTKPQFEWRIFGPSGQHGEPVKTGTPYALINMKVEPNPDFLIFLEQQAPKVVDLGWTSSPQWLNKFVTAAQVAKAFAAAVV